MRTPLNAVIGFSSLAQLPGVTEAQKDDYLGKIQSSGRLLLDLVNDTLTISKTANGKMQLSLSPMTTDALTAQIIAEIQEMASAKGIAFTADQSACRPQTVMADPLNVQKILLNLLNNAVKYTPEGGTVSFTAADCGDHDGIVYTVRDTGIGISADFLPRLYEPFAQERRKGYEGMGTGLGLAIVHDLVELMHGTIQVDTKVNEGTCFTVILPLKETQPVSEQQAAAASEEDLSLLKGRKVLLVEDNEINRQIAVMMLSSMGVETDQAADGREGLERFAASNPGTYSAILMDLRMPVMDGYESARRIRRLDRRDAGKIPIIAMTADVFAEDIRRCMEAGMNDHVAKPVDAVLLRQALIRQIAAHSEKN
jgi:CheY-like chemotaxis protein